MKKCLVVRCLGDHSIGYEGDHGICVAATVHNSDAQCPGHPNSLPSVLLQAYCVRIITSSMCLRCCTICDQLSNGCVASALSHRIFFRCPLSRHDSSVARHTQPTMDLIIFSGRHRVDQVDVVSMEVCRGNINVWVKQRCQRASNDAIRQCVYPTSSRAIL